MKLPSSRDVVYEMVHHVQAILLSLYAPEFVSPMLGDCDRNRNESEVLLCLPRHMDTDIGSGESCGIPFHSLDTTGRVDSLELVLAVCQIQAD